MQTRRLFVSLAFGTALSAQCIMDVNNPGIPLSLTDDSVRTMILGFNFPFNGTTYDRITICSNGFVWLGTAPAVNAAEFTDSEASFLSNAARVAVCWDDWNPTNATAGNGVFYYTNGVQASVTWKQVPHYPNGPAMANMQVQLDAAGNILVSYDASMGATATAVVGLTQGGGAAANPLDLSTLPAPLAATGYEVFPGAIDLVGTSQLWLATTPTSYTPIAFNPPLCNPSLPFPPLASNISIGAGCPAPTTGSFYEFFSASTLDLSNSSIKFTAVGGPNYIAGPGPGFDNTYVPGDALAQADDSQVTVSTALMGNFPFGGGSLTSVAVCSNGYLWLAPNALNDYTPTVATFSAQAARIAPLWCDFNFTGGGTFYWTATPAFSMATWENVPTYGTTGTQNTFQCKLFPNGDIVFSYGTVLNNATLVASAIVGLSGGLNGTPTGSVNIGNVIATPALVDLTPAPVMPPALAHAATNLPALGSTYTVTTTSLPAGAVIGAIVVGFNNPNVDLTFLGMTGCHQYATQDFVSVQVIGGPSMTLNLVLPPVVAYAGINLFSQGAVFAPLNPFGVISSNGVRGTVGF